MSDASLYLNEITKNKLRLHDGISLSGAISKSVDRLNFIVSSEEKYLKDLFSEMEWKILREISKGTKFEPASLIPGIFLGIVNITPESIFTKHGVSRRILNSKLTGLSISQDFSLVDLLERSRP